MIYYLQEEVKGPIQRGYGENPLPQIDKDLRVKAESLVIVNLDKLPFIPVLVQTGYLTIVGEDRSGYRLDFPNHEVVSSYALWSIVSATQKDAIPIQSLGSMHERNVARWLVEDCES